MKLQYSANTHVGLQRQINQDYYGVSGPTQGERLGYLLVICDGMGGHKSGEIASRMGVETILEQYYSSSTGNRPESLEHAFTAANQRIYHQGQGGMGTTGVAALIDDHTLYIANVGDSRAYLVRAGEIHQISHDHSFVWEQVAAGVLTREQARVSQYRNMITRALGHRDEVEVDMFTETLQHGDTILLSSDGLHGLVEDEELADVITRLAPEQAVQHLIEQANQRGGFDNITVVVARVEEETDSLRGDRPTPVLERIPDTRKISDTDELPVTEKLPPDEEIPPQPETADEPAASNAHTATERRYTNPPPSQRSAPAKSTRKQQARAPAKSGGCTEIILLAILIALVGGGGVYSASAYGYLPPIPPLVVPTETPTPTATMTPTHTPTATFTPSPTNTATPTYTATATFTPSPTNTATPSPTFTATATLTPTIPLPIPPEPTIES